MDNTQHIALACVRLRQISASIDHMIDADSGSHPVALLDAVRVASEQARLLAHELDPLRYRLEAAAGTDEKADA